jgi:hypothetical protein
MERVKFTRPTKRTPLLPTESAEEYERDRCGIERAIEPCDAIEQIYCDDFIYECQQMRRLQRWTTALLNTVFADAVHAVLRGLNELENINVDFVIGRACNDPIARATVSDILATHGLNDSAIEAGAFRRCTRDLTAIDRLLTSHVSRRDKGLQFIAFLREMKARHLQLAVKSAGGKGAVPRLDHRTTRHRHGKNGEQTTTHS